MSRTNLLLIIIATQLTALLAFDVVELVTPTKVDAPVTSVCVKEDTNTLTCYCRR